MQRKVHTHTYIHTHTHTHIRWWRILGLFSVGGRSYLSIAAIFVTPRRPRSSWRRSTMRWRPFFGRQPWRHPSPAGLHETRRRLLYYRHCRYFASPAHPVWIFRSTIIATNTTSLRKATLPIASSPSSADAAGYPSSVAVAEQSWLSHNSAHFQQLLFKAQLYAVSPTCLLLLDNFLARRNTVLINAFVFLFVGPFVLTKNCTIGRQFNGVVASYVLSACSFIFLTIEVFRCVLASL